VRRVLTLDVITKDLAVALGSSLSETLNTTNNGPLDNRRGWLWPKVS